MEEDGGRNTLRLYEQRFPDWVRAYRHTPLQILSLSFNESPAADV
jgi:hypothetical protein